MGRLRDIVSRAAHPRKGALLACAAATAALDALVFGTGSDGAWWAYAVYLFSAYTLIAIIAALVPGVLRVWRRIAAHPRIAPFAQNEAARAAVSGIWAVLFDVAYAVFTLVTGFRYDSGWAVSVALYYFAVAAMGFAIAYGIARGRNLNPGERRLRELRMARGCGVLLLVMALTLSGVMAQMVARRQAWVYSDIVVITNATFTFVNLVLAIRSVVLMRKADRPAVVASRSMGLSKTLVSLFFLETTMIAVFGSGAEDFRFAMEAVTGAVVFLLVVAIAALLIAYSVRNLRLSEAEQN